MSEGGADLLRPYALASPGRYAAALATATNEITRRAPAPRDLPFFGLDHPHGTRARRLDRLSELGIFRVYERVLDLGAGLGGPARWLARRRGCSVVSFDRNVERAAASRLLVRRAHLQRSVRVSVAALDRLPVASHSFTHAWSVEALQPEIDKPAVVAELFRAVRPGGHVALQEWVRSPPTAAATATGYEPLAAFVGALGAAGFQDVRGERADALGEEESAIGEILRERLAELLGEPRDAEREAIESARERLEAGDRAAADGAIELVQIFARKPS